VYEFQQITADCDEGAEINFSAPLMVAAAGFWGDLIGQGSNEPPNGDPNFTDISGLVDKFKNAPNAPGLGSADLSPSQTDGRVDFTDISMCVDAFRGFEYPFSGPLGCP
jgi:hypothetical protein